MGPLGVRILLRARGGLPRGTVHDHPPDAGGDGRSGLPELHGSLPSGRGALLGAGVQLRLVGRDDDRGDRGAIFLWDDPGSASFVLTAIGLVIWVIGILIVSNVWKTPTYKKFLDGDPEAPPANWETDRRTYFTINWIQL